ncbi:hypothetical protein CEUSTIGMA_g2458.t1 [Chlamydomonas eustigma]|uniref:MYND-type domain-containing protein n=1 Tax=Chlamydomonas eustigma TaxID=1157962 RepID=A0A250WWL7_9CHLO|nr:hypothetical protein CEUSTIGMA_g2458.t1 [Chlamydomonas eustigma]|eukprot:GAX75012.1 hypothetical protein CEUSTIGMA_g2458.t1 [Chlamydomonas eustigma]
MDSEEGKECANCGASDNLLRCGRCRNEWFCSNLCQKSYWPFHRDFCKRNEFADAVEESEPKFAKWMRDHKKLAVLKDDEVERLERVSKAACSVYSRQDIMESMYGRVDPKPLAPSYSVEQKLAMEARQRQEEQQALQMLLLDGNKEWASILIPEGLGLECARYKWRQSQSHVELFCQVPRGVAGKKVKVVLERKHLSVYLGADPGLWWIHGDLHQEILPRQSTWIVADGVLHVTMLKKYRKGHYNPDGGTNADTWWRSLMSRAGSTEIIPLSHPPTRYYWTEYDEDDLLYKPDNSK